jgi:C4-dicarboxylate-specific signal transduction histidine kinase
MLCKPALVVQALYNLLSNAFDAVNGHAHARIEFHVSLQGDLVSFSVLDNGPPIPENVRMCMKQPFFTTKDVGKGFGLGLSVADGIARSHGGRLYLDETVASTRFVMELPRR